MQIANMDGNRPVVRLPQSLSDLSVPHVSIAHSAGTVVAAAVDAGVSGGIGIDIEQQLRMTDDVIEAGFAGQELKLLSAEADSERIERALRMWCAKEAALKAAGDTAESSTLDYLVTSINPVSGIVEIINKSAAQNAMQVHTTMINGFCYAAAVAPPVARITEEARALS
jgi:phosphopantetheinyl transferase